MRTEPRSLRQRLLAHNLKRRLALALAFESEKITIKEMNEQRTLLREREQRILAMP